ncbi:protein FREE1-like [Bidens hawaiensis]|uniref:protein FREE1-like n=1 Tax=Bidens hawaiensis TaxID=980011 RepID=UPI00404B7AA7
MQQGDYTSPYYPNYPPNPNPNPNPTTTDLHQPPPFNYASAPPTTYHPPPPSSDYYPPPPTAPSYTPNPQFDISHTSYQSQPPPYNSNNNNNNPPYDQHPNYTPTSPIPQFNHTSPFQYSPSPSPYNNNINTQPSVPSQVYETSYDTGYAGNNHNNHYAQLGAGGDYYGNQPPESSYREGVYAYQGGKVEPYGSRGTGSKSSMWKEPQQQQVLFDDFGRPIGLPGKDKDLAPKVVKAVPKAETLEDVKGGVQKFRVKLLAESGGQSTMDVLCQVGLDGIRMLDPSTSRTLRIYSLDAITRCEVYDSSTLAFWSKSSVDIEPRRIRLQSNSYTTNTLLDTITAATIQVKEMGVCSRPVEAVKVTEQSTEKKKGLGDWMNKIKPVNEEKDHWVPDEAVTKCTGCGSDFSAFNRKHHCRNCGDIFCDKCTQGRIALTSEENAPQVRVCDRCMLEVSHRLSSAKEVAANRSSGLQRHDDLAKKLQELERNHKPSSGSKFEGSSRRMKEVACPTCTVHLQVQVPSSGSETIECGVCQHPFLVNAR